MSICTEKSRPIAHTRTIGGVNLWHGSECPSKPRPPDGSNALGGSKSCQEIPGGVGKGTQGIRDRSA